MSIEQPTSQPESKPKRESNPFRFEVHDDEKQKTVTIRDGADEYVFVLRNGKPFTSWDPRERGAISGAKWHSMMQIVGDHLKRLQ